MKQLNWYQIFGQTKVIPDGKTVEPTDDIQIWLHCADIWDKTYTTLAEVLTDTDTLSALINSNNAVDYLVRSKWCGIDLVPIMTSNTTPSGVCIGSTFYGTGNEFYKAFDENRSTLWASQNSDKTNAWIGYAFDAPVICKSFILNSYTGRTFATVYVEGSDDGITWTTLNGGSTINVTSAQDNPTKFIFTNSTAYLKYRLRTATQVNSSWNCNVRELQFCTESLCDNSTAMTYIGLNNYCANTLLSDSTWCDAICNSTYFESVLNVKVPTMTSNTTPSGAVITRSGVRDNEESWKAFDGNDNTYWLSQAVTPAQGLSGAWIQCEFETPIKIKKLYASIGLSTTTSAEPYFACKLLASNVNNDWSNATVLYDETVNSTNASDKTSRGIASSALNNDNTYKYLRLHVYRTYTSLVYTVNFYDWTTQFYGRADV